MTQLQLLLPFTYQPILNASLSWCFFFFVCFFPTSFPLTAGRFTALVLLAFRRARGFFLLVLIVKYRACQILLAAACCRNQGQRCPNEMVGGGRGREGTRASPLAAQKKKKNCSVLLLHRRSEHQRVNAAVARGDVCPSGVISTQSIQALFISLACSV